MVMKNSVFSVCRPDLLPDDESSSLMLQDTVPGNKWLRLNAFGDTCKGCQGHIEANAFIPAMNITNRSFERMI